VGRNGAVAGTHAADAGCDFQFGREAVRAAGCGGRPGVGHGERGDRSHGINRDGHVSWRSGTVDGGDARKIAGAVAASLGKRNRAGGDGLYRRNRGRTTDDAGPGRFGLFGDDSRRGDGCRRSDYLDGRGRRADGGPAVGGGGAHDPGDFLSRSSRVGLLRRESPASEDAESRGTSGDSGVDSQ